MAQNLEVTIDMGEKYDIIVCRVTFWMALIP